MLSTAKHLILTVLLLALLAGCSRPAPAGSPGADAAPESGIVATIAGEPVSEAQWQQGRAYALATMRLLAQPGEELDERSVFSTFLEDLMLVRAAAEAGYDLDGATVAAEERTMLQVAGADGDRLDSVLAEAGLTSAAWQEELKRSVFAATYLEDVLLAAVPASQRAQRRQDALAALKEKYGVRVLAEPERSEGVRVGDIAPAFTLQDLEGNTVQLADLAGKAVILNFWATWCAPCREEMPLLQQAYEQYGKDGLVVVGVNVGETPAQAAAFRDEFGLTMPVLVDGDSAVSRLYRVFGLPTTFFIDRQGVIHYLLVGPVSQALLDHQIPALLQPAGG